MVKIQRVDEAALDEMWSYVGRKDHPRWFWQALDHQSGKGLADVFGDPKDAGSLQVKARLEPFGITRFYTEEWGAYERHLSAEEHVIGKRHTQKIERKQLPLRTRLKRLARKTSGFSTLKKMQDIVMGLLIHRYEFGVLV